MKTQLPTLIYAPALKDFPELIVRLSITLVHQLLVNMEVHAWKLVVRLVANVLLDGPDRLAVLVSFTHTCRLLKKVIAFINKN